MNPKAGRAPSRSTFFDGLRDPWRGLTFLTRHPSLWPFAALPFLIGLAVYGAIIFFGWHFFQGWMDEVIQQEGWLWKTLGVLVRILYWVLMLVVAAFTFVPVVAIVASPFNDLLSEKTERLYRNVNVDQPFSVGLFLRSIRIGLIGDLKRTATLFGLLALAFGFNFIPIVGSALSGILSTYFVVSYLSLEFTSYSMDRRLYTWDQKKDYLSRFRSRTLGFGAMALFLMTVPLLNAMFIPVSAVGGTLLFCDTELNE